MTVNDMLGSGLAQSAKQSVIVGSWEEWIHHWMATPSLEGRLGLLHSGLDHLLEDRRAMEARTPHIIERKHSVKIATYLNLVSELGQEKTESAGFLIAAKAKNVLVSRFFNHNWGGDTLNYVHARKILDCPVLMAAFVKFFDFTNGILSYTQSDDPTKREDRVISNYFRAFCLLIIDTSHQNYSPEMLSSDQEKSLHSYRKTYRPQLLRTLFSHSPETVVRYAKVDIEDVKHLLKEYRVVLDPKDALSGFRELQNLILTPHPGSPRANQGKRLLELWIRFADLSQPRVTTRAAD